MNVPKPRKLPSGNYFIQLRLDGKSISITERTAKECIHQAELAKAEYKVGKPVQKRAKAKFPTLFEAMDKYIASRENVLSPSTIRGYRMIQNNRFQSVMQTPLNKIENWQEIVNNESPLCSAKSLKNAWGLVSSVLKNENMPVKNISLPQIVKTESKFLPYDEIPAFLTAISGNPHETAMLLALHGLRRSEIYALQWEDINLKRKTVHVNGSYIRDSDGVYRRKAENKNVSSNRIVPIMIDRLYDLLSEQQQKTGFVITGYPEQLTVNLKSICKRNGFAILTAHDLRRSFASLCYHLNVPERVTMRLGGWSDINVMHNIYIKLADNDVDKYANDLIVFYKNANANANEKL